VEQIATTKVSLGALVIASAIAGATLSWPTTTSSTPKAAASRLPPEVERALLDRRGRVIACPIGLTSRTAKPGGPTLHGQVSNRELTIAVSEAEHNLEGCFDEWSERQALKVIKRPASKDAQLVVNLGVTPDGVGHDASAKGELEVAHDGTLIRVHGTLSICVEDAIKRVAFPKGPEALDVTVQIAWEAPGIVNTSGRVVERHETSSHTSVATRVDELVQQNADQVNDIIARADNAAKNIEAISNELRGLSKDDPKHKALLDNLDQALADAQDLIATANKELQRPPTEARAVHVSASRSCCGCSAEAPGSRAE
jgi:hypothetical protein